MIWPGGNLDCGPASPDWPMYGQNVCNTLAQKNGGGISKDTVKNLTVKWVHMMAGDVSATPAVVGGDLYVPDWGGMISRLDTATGTPVWTERVGDLVQPGAPDGGLPGFMSRTTPVVTADAVIFGTGRTIPDIIASQGQSAFVVAVDKNTGALKWTTPVHEGHPAASITGSPVIDGGRVYIGVASQEEGFGRTGSYTYSFRGSVVALDIATGKVIWQTHTISDDVYYGPGGRDGGQLSGYAGNSVWSSAPAVDRKRKQIYVTTGNNYDTPSGTPDAVPGNYVETVLALDMDTGKVNWSSEATPEGDIWTFTHLSGPDSDFGAGANLFSATVNGVVKDLVGAGQKSGVYWALDANTGEQVWHTTVGPTGHLGGIQWGTAADGTRIYVGVNNETGASFALGGNGPHAGETITTGAWGALDPATGAILWQIADPAMTMPLLGASVNGPVTAVNGVVFAGSMDPMGTMFAFDAATGDVLWSFESGGTVYGGPAVAGGVVYWGSGYPSTRLQFGTTSQKLYAFQIGQPSTDGGPVDSGEAGASDAGSDAGADSPSPQDAGAADAPVE
jgi:polyvinyl alcohol dehydrogenase (cytochrome)